MSAIDFLLIVLQMLLILGFSPLIVGVIRRVKAHQQCRHGASVFQPYADLAKLFRKEQVISTTASWIFPATPYILFSSTLAASLLVPTIIAPMPLNFAGNIIALVYLLALGTFFLMLAGLDAGSAFGGMGSSREAIVASLTEPALILSLFAVALTAGSANISAIVYKTAILQGIVPDPPPHLMALVALFIITLAETGRVPVDNPATHLELTMIHEVMVLDHGGVDLAYILYAAALKFWLLGTLLTGMFGGTLSRGWMADSVLFVFEMVLLAVIVGAVESTLARLRLLKVPHFLIIALALSAVALILTVRA